MGILRKIFEARTEWWHLVPDQTIFTSGGNTSGKVLNLAARHKDGKWLMASFLHAAAWPDLRVDDAGGDLAHADEHQTHQTDYGIGASGPLNLLLVVRASP
jgi:hypothetical protein